MVVGDRSCTQKGGKGGGRGGRKKRRPLPRLPVHRKRPTDDRFRSEGRGWNRWKRNRTANSMLKVFKAYNSAFLSSFSWFVAPDSFVIILVNLRMLRTWPRRPKGMLRTLRKWRLITNVLFVCVWVLTALMVTTSWGQRCVPHDIFLHICT